MDPSASLTLRRQPASLAPTTGLTVIVPAYNEAASIADTVRSLQRQTVPIDEIIVVDDCSTDDTSGVVRALGVTVLTPPRNTGSKAGAQTFALGRVRTRYTMAIDADTVLAPDSVERLLTALDDPTVAAACGFVIPRYVRTVWERGRYIEYLFAFSFYKPIQDYYGWPLISSGCFSVYRTEALVACGGWSNRTMAEDMDLTWTFHQRGWGVRFVPDAVCYPIEPHSFHFLAKQLRRWSHGFIQNVLLHRNRISGLSFLRSTVAVALWDASIASLAYLVVMPLVSIFVSPLFLFGYIVDLPAVAVPAIVQGYRRGELRRAIASLPSFLVLRLVNAIFMVRALVAELILRRPLTVYEKGH